MRHHLDDAEFAAALVPDELEDDVAEHVAACAECRRQLADMRSFVALRRHEAAAGAPEWDRQRERVIVRVAGADDARRRRRWLRAALAAAALVVAAVGVGVLQHRGDDRVRDLAVEEILAETEALLADDSIPGFEAIDPGLEGLQQATTDGRS